MTLLLSLLQQKNNNSIDGLMSKEKAISFSADQASVLTKTETKLKKLGIKACLTL